MLAFREVLQSAYDEKPETKHYWNYLVYAVAKKLGIVLPKGLSADQLIEHMRTMWYTIPTIAEAELRSQNHFVVAGLKGADHKRRRDNGHVAIVIPRTTQKEHRRLGISWPYAWSAGIQSTGNLSIGSEIWTMDDAPRIKFFTPSSIRRLNTVPPYTLGA